MSYIVVRNFLSDKKVSTRVNIDGSVFDCIFYVCLIISYFIIYQINCQFSVKFAIFTATVIASPLSLTVTGFFLSILTSHKNEMISKTENEQIVDIRLHVLICFAFICLGFFLQKLIS